MMTAPKIIADSSLTTSYEGWPDVVPTFRFHEVETRLCARHDFINGQWVERFPEDTILFKNAAYEDIYTLYMGALLAIIRVRRVTPLQPTEDPVAGDEFEQWLATAEISIGELARDGTKAVARRAWEASRKAKDKKKELSRCPQCGSSKPEDNQYRDHSFWGESRMKTCHDPFHGHAGTMGGPA